MRLVAAGKPQSRTSCIVKWASDDTDAVEGAFAGAGVGAGAAAAAGAGAGAAVAGAVAGEGAFAETVVL